MVLMPLESMREVWVGGILSPVEVELSAEGLVSEDEVVVDGCWITSSSSSDESGSSPQRVADDIISIYWYY